MAKTRTPPAEGQSQAGPTDKHVAKVGARPSLVVSMALKYGIEPEKMMATLKQTAFRQRGKNGGTPPEITNEQMMALMLVANEYDLNPWTKEIYAFPQDGGIVPVVGIDGWIRMINRHPQFDSMELEQAPHEPGEIPEWFECRIQRKDRSKPTVLREYYVECKRNTDPWNMMPRRMLRHKAIKECGRVAFGFGGIYDADEADYMLNAIDVTPRKGKPTVEAPRAIASPGETNESSGETKARQAETAAQASANAAATSEQLAHIRKILDSTGVPENETCEQFGVDALETLKFDQVAGVVAWIDKVNKG